MWESIAPRSAQFYNTLLIAAVYFAARLLLTAAKLLFLRCATFPSGGLDCASLCSGRRRSSRVRCLNRWRLPAVWLLQRHALSRFLDTGLNWWTLIWMNVSMPLLISEYRQCCGT